MNIIRDLTEKFFSKKQLKSFNMTQNAAEVFASAALHLLSLLMAKFHPQRDKRDSFACDIHPLFAGTPLWLQRVYTVIPFFPH